MISFVLIALVPVSLLGIALYNAAWDNAWREINEKHRLLALNLGSPLQIYVNDHHTMLRMLAMSIHQTSINESSHLNTARLFQNTLSVAHDFQALILLDTTNNAHVVVHQNGDIRYNSDTYSNDPSYIDTLMDEKAQASGTKFSALDSKPTLLLTEPVYDTNNTIIGVLVAELSIAPVEQLRRNIRFGTGGHSAIVDQFGHVIAHPNQGWMAEIRDISALPIVQQMMAGKTGVTEFFSPFVKTDMVAGYTAVPDIGWGVMVPQPRAEVEEQVYTLLYQQLLWASMGLALAIMFAVLLARWITQPIQRLAKNANALMANNFQGSIPASSQHTPEEIHQLEATLREVINGLILSRKEVHELNLSLQQRVNQATQQLRNANKQLRGALEKADEFMAFARHDLRKPIAVIKDIADVIFEQRCSGDLSENELQEMLQLITQSARYMQDIIDDFLDRKALIEGRMIMNPGPTDINKVLQLIVRSNQHYAARKGIQLSQNLTADIQTAALDESRISQVCQNLIDNAIKFCKQGDHVSITTQQHSDSIEVRISDTGPGLTDSDLQQLFKKGVQLSNNPTGGEISSGIGLLRSSNCIMVKLAHKTIPIKVAASGLNCPILLLPKQAQSFL
jgi:signal transduction histidine kinase